jgi:hypothetical protein
MLERNRQRRVVVHLMGGLGNQMFQYAFGRRLAIQNAAVLILDVSGYESKFHPDPTVGRRVFGLSPFRIRGEIAGPGEIFGKSSLKRIPRKLLRLAQRIGDRRKPYYLRSEVVEPPEQRFRYDPRIAERTFEGTLFVRGFWQSETYFAPVAATVRRELEVREPLDGRNAELAVRIMRTESVAVHVRHGDNATAVAAQLGVLAPGYYARAMELLERKVPNAEYFVFSDDPNWSRQFFNSAKPLAFVAYNGALAAHEDMRLMSLCRHHILANSTFGWWGAWLAGHAGQVVVAPRRYYQEMDFPNPDLYPSHWRLL